MSIRTFALLGLVLTAASASAQTNVADYNLNPLSRAYASDSGNFRSRPSGPINGNTDPIYWSSEGTFYHSGTTAGGVLLDPAAANRPYWYVDLGANYDVSKLVFFYRQQCCENQNDGDVLSLWLSPPDFTNPGAALFSRTLTYSGSPTDVFTLGTPITARYASVQADLNGAIVFPELQVFAVPTDVTATPEPASLVLLATGLTGVAVTARRRKRIAR